MPDDPTAEKMVILTRTFDLMEWLLPRTERFPKPQRFVVTKRLQDALLDFHEALHDANAHQGRDRMRQLNAADAQLDKLRLYLRFAHQWRWLSDGQYRHVSAMVAEIGRLLGGWKRQTASLR